MGDRKLEYMEFMFKETPDKYLEDTDLLLYDDALDSKVNDIMELYMDSFFTQDEEVYEKYKEEKKEFMNYLDNHENQELVSEFKDTYIAESTMEYEFDPDKKYMEATIVDLDKAMNKFKDKVPLYIIFNNSSHWYSRIIAKLSKGDFSHVGMSFKGPDEILSFDLGHKTDGMKVENIFELISDRASSYLKVVALPLDKDTYKKVYQHIRKMRMKRSNYSYDLTSVITFPFRKAEELTDWTWENTTFFCSQFVSWVLGNIFDVIDTSHITPTDLLTKIDDIKDSVTVFEGSIKEFDVSKFKKFEDSFRDTKDKLEKEAQENIEKIKSKLKQESRLLSEVSSTEKEKKMNTLYNILYNEFPDDSLNSNYHEAFNSIMLDS